MYIISHQALQAIHQDLVNDCLKRSEQRRMLKATRRQADTGAKAWDPSTTLRALVRSMLGVVARP